MYMSGLFLSFDGIVFSLPIFMVMTSLVFGFPFMNNMLSPLIMLLQKSMTNMFSGKSTEFSSSLSLSICLLFFLFIFNTLSMFPFFFCVTSLPSFSLVLSFTVWISVFLLGFGMKVKDALVHITPLGAPMGLASGLMLIEMVSNLIRCITLGVRLLANLTSGHIIMGLMASIQVESVSALSQLVLLVLELMVALIQSYVFALLTFLYLMET